MSIYFSDLYNNINNMTVCIWPFKLIHVSLFLPQRERKSSVKVREQRMDFVLDLH